MGIAMPSKKGGQGTDWGLQQVETHPKARHEEEGCFEETVN